MFHSSTTIVSYAVRVPLKDHWQDAFDIPPVNTICGLDAAGELFHARAKCLKMRNDCMETGVFGKIEGYCGNDPSVTARLISPLKEQELHSTLDRYFSKRIEFINRSKK